jgi:hypothetical protein
MSVRVLCAGPPSLRQLEECAIVEGKLIFRAGGRGFESGHSCQAFHLEPGLVARTPAQSFGARLPDCLI